MKLTYQIEVEPTPEQLAEMWWSMDGNQQAEFFNWLGTNLNTGGHLPMQLQFVSDAEELEPEGRSAMRSIGEYGDQSREEPG